MHRQVPVSRAPQQLIVTVFAQYARDPERPVAVADLIRLMASLDVDESAVRSALMRLKRRGILVPARRNGDAAYALGPELLEVIAEGDKRIFSPQRNLPGDRWLLTTFSVPESQRNLRHQIRTILSRRGFGTVAKGLWIAPEFAYLQIREELERHQLLEYVEFFAADPLSEKVAAYVAQWWDLDALAALYRGFCKQFGPILARWEIAGGTDAEAFADHTLLVTAWRRLTYLDPGLPLAYLPENWPGLAAEQLFQAMHKLLREPACRHATVAISSADKFSSALSLTN